jgi:Domain of unknown function (DUF222)/HNH endonuclease
MEQQQADALALLAETALHHGIDSGAPGERYQVVVHVDAAVLADPDQIGQSVLDEGARVPAGTSQRLACDASRVVMRHVADGRLMEVGARTRTIPPALRRALHHRDRGCRFPGCGVRFGQGHHIRHWAQGGPTTLSNLALLCRPRGPRGGLQGRTPVGRRASVPAPRRLGDPRRPATDRTARGSRGCRPSAERRQWTGSARADRHAGLAGGASGRGLCDRRLAPAGAEAQSRRLSSYEAVRPS